jgi:DNA-directed RNA polymerase subunit RPC12/RpoP
MAAEQSPLHCPDCGHDLLVITGKGLFCARCGAEVAKIPAGSNLMHRAELAARRLTARQKSPAGTLH